MSRTRRVTAFLDASVLYSAPLRDLLMHLAMRDLFLARWSDRVHEEWITALLRNRSDLTPERLARTRRLMDDNIDDALVRGYEPIVDQLTLPDPNDRHVLAAAIHGGASVIVTVNLRDFPTNILTTHGIEAQHPDTFIGARLPISRTKFSLRYMSCGSTSKIRPPACPSCLRPSSAKV